jgi:hypothetical protein
MKIQRSIGRAAAISNHRRAPRYFTLVIVCLMAATILSGCAVNRESANVNPGVDLNSLKNFYVVKFGPDNRGINSVIRDRLITMGYSASTGTDNKPPRKVDAIVTYRDKWQWDITMYLIELTITLRNPDTEFPMAVGNSYHTSLTRRTTEQMVEEVLRNIFAKAKQ